MSDEAVEKCGTFKLKMEDVHRYVGGYTAVKEVVREIAQKSQEVFVPLSHPPGEAQFDFGHALARIGGKLRKVAFLVMALPYSDVFLVQAFDCGKLWRAFGDYNRGAKPAQTLLFR